MLGAETLKRGVPVSLGWLPMLAILVPFAVGAALASSVSRQAMLLAIGAIIAISTPLFTEARQWFLDVTPALCLLTCVVISLISKRFRARGTVNLSSGLPNLVALRAGGPQRDHALIVARIINYPQLAAAIAGDSERALVDQIVQRLTVGAQDHVIFQGDEGIFAGDRPARRSAIMSSVASLYAARAIEGILMTNSPSASDRYGRSISSASTVQVRRRRGRERRTQVAYISREA